MKTRLASLKAEQRLWIRRVKALESSHIRLLKRLERLAARA